MLAEFQKDRGAKLRLYAVGDDGAPAPVTGALLPSGLLIVAEAPEKARQAADNHRAKAAGSAPPTPGTPMPGTPAPGTPAPAGPRAAPQTPPGVAQAQPLTPHARAARIQFLVDRLASDAEELRALLRQA